MLAFKTIAKVGRAIALLLLFVQPTVAKSIKFTLSESSINVDQGDGSSGEVTATKAPFEVLQSILDGPNRWSSSDRLDIYIGPGLYRMARPLRLLAQQLRGSTVTIRGAGQTATRISGSIVIDGVVAPYAISLLPEALVGRFLTYSYGTYGKGKPIEPHPLIVWSGDKRLVPGRWPKRGWALIESASKNEHSWRVKLSAEDGARPDLVVGVVRASGFPGIDWSYESFPARVVGADEIEFPLSSVQYGVRVGTRIILEAAHGKGSDEQLQVDARAGSISLAPGLTANLSVAESFMEIDGAEKVAVSGMTIEGFRGDAIRVISGTDIAITANKFQHIGNRAVVVRSGKRIRIVENEIRMTGEGGIDAEGGDRITLEHGEIDISDNSFDHFSEIALTYRPAIRIAGVGANVARNKIKNGPHLAILFEGSEHRILENDISAVLSEVTDSGAIYSWRDWATYGTVIEKNLIYGISPNRKLRLDGPRPTHSIKGVYLDDLVSGITIRENIFFGVENAIFINGGSDNQVRGNIFIDCDPSLLFYAWGQAIAREKFNDGYRAIAILNDLKLKKSKLLSRYPRLGGSIDELLVPKGNIWSNDNILVNSPQPKVFGKFLPDFDMLSGRHLIVPDTSRLDPRDRLNSFQKILAKVKQHLDAVRP